MTRPPCKDCRKRHAECHATCDDYQAYARDRMEYLENRINEADKYLDAKKREIYRFCTKRKQRTMRHGRIKK